MAQRDVTSAMADHWRAQHDKMKGQRDQLREALEDAATRLDMIARSENNYFARSGAEQASAVLKATEEES